MKVAGGTYWEVCEFPRDEQLSGSGLRAAAAVGEVSEESTDLYTFVGDERIGEAERWASTYGFTLHPEDIQETVSFHYIHNHSHPKKEANIQTHDREIGPISDDAILRFGLVEGTAVVEGKRVVYDPQSEKDERFHENGSSADELALVLNRGEAETFSGNEKIEDILDALTSGDYSADVVVVKCGSAGAVIRTEDRTTEIPVYETDTVWNIGSGDIFSAMFAVYWAEGNLPAHDAAKEASLATAYFCSTRNLPIPPNPLKISGFDPKERPATINQEPPTVYLAAPFFTPGEFWLMEEIGHILSEERVEVVAPYFDIGHAESFRDSEDMTRRDLEALEDSDVLLALLDTGDPGTIFEIGYARKAGIPVVVYQMEQTPERLTMLEGTNCEIYGDLSTAIFKAIWKASW